MPIALLFLETREVQVHRLSVASARSFVTRQNSDFVALLHRLQCLLLVFVFKVQFVLNCKKSPHSDSSDQLLSFSTVDVIARSSHRR